MKITLPDFIIVPYQLLEDDKMTLIDERLYGIIYWFAKLKLEKCIASNATLSNLVKTTPTTIANSLTKLEGKGYIKRIFADSSSRHRLEIIPLIVFSRVSPTDDRHSLTDDRSFTHSIKGHSLTDEQKYNIENNKIEEYKNSEEASQINKLIDLFKVVNPSYSKLFANKTQRIACERMIKLHGFKKLDELINVLPSLNQDKYAPVITTPVQLEDKFGQLIAYGQKKQNNQPLMI